MSVNKTIREVAEKHGLRLVNTSASAYTDIRVKTAAVDFKNFEEMSEVASESGLVPVVLESRDGFLFYRRVDGDVAPYNPIDEQRDGFKFFVRKDADTFFTKEVRPRFDYRINSIADANMFLLGMERVQSVIENLSDDSLLLVENVGDLECYKIVRILPKHPAEWQQYGSIYMLGLIEPE